MHAGSLMPPRSGKMDNAATSRLVLLLTALIVSVALFAFFAQGPRMLISAGLDSIGTSSGPEAPLESGAALHDAIPLVPPAPQYSEPGCTKDQPRLAITCSTNEPLHRILQWMRYHQLIGFELFYLFVEGNAEDSAVVDVLRSLVGVKVFLRDDRLRWWHKHSRAHHENWLQKFFGQPCNGELFVKQAMNMEIAIHQARADGAAWLGHIDTDELVYPSGSASYSMHEILHKVPDGAHALVLPNYEALPEHDQVVNPALEVSLFKVAVDHIDSTVMQQNYRHIAHGNPNYFIAYSNGKSLARVEQGLRPHGAHRWASYNGSFQAYTHEQGAVLHYTYNRVSDLLGRRDRCECAPTEADVKRCFWLAFDQEAFVAAALKTDEQLRDMFNERLVWKDPEMVAQMRMRGLIERIYTPQILLRQLPDNVGDSMAWRSTAKREEDDLVRQNGARKTHLRRFNYTNAAALHQCGDFLREDSSLNILELMGPVPPDDVKKDSDRLLIERMRAYQQSVTRDSGNSSTI